MQESRLFAAVAPAIRHRSPFFHGTTVTYSFPGRLVATALITLPLLWFLKVLIPAGFVGVIAYGVCYPRALRDIWTRR